MSLLGCLPLCLSVCLYFSAPAFDFLPLCLSVCLCFSAPAFDFLHLCLRFNTSLPLALRLCFPSLVSLSVSGSLTVSLFGSFCVSVCLHLTLSVSVSASISLFLSHFLSFSLWHLLFSFIPIHLSTPLSPISDSSQPLTHQLLPDPQQTLPGTSSARPWGREGLTHLLHWGDSPQGARGWAQPRGHQSSLPQLLPELHSL